MTQSIRILNIKTFCQETPRSVYKFDVNAKRLIIQDSFQKPILAEFHLEIQGQSDEPGVFETDSSRFNPPQEVNRPESHITGI